MVTPRQASRVLARVVYLAGAEKFSKDIMVPVGQTLGWALNASGLFARYPVLREARIGVWGTVLPPETLVSEGDRIEVYTLCDPAAREKVRRRGKSIASDVDSSDKKKH